MKKKEEVRSFKDNLKSLLLRHSFRPALQMEIICILVVVIGGWWGIASNREANSHVCDALEQTITVYGELLDQLAAEDHIINSETSLTRRTSILKRLYTASAQAGYEANMYILDPEGNILVSSRENVSDEEKVLVRNWKILEQLKEHPEQIQMDASRVAAGIITGIGILGGGLIFTGKQGLVSGMTTAAGIWVTVGVGMAVGSGMYPLGIAVTILTLAAQFVFHRNLRICREPLRGQIVFSVANSPEAIENVIRQLETLDMEVVRIKTEIKDRKTCLVRCSVALKPESGRKEFATQIAGLGQIVSYEI